MYGGGLLNKKENIAYVCEEFRTQVTFQGVLLCVICQSVYCGIRTHEYG